jgi:hypothetical protein
VVAPVTIPVSATDNALGLLGLAWVGGTTPADDPSGSPGSSGSADPVGAGPTSGNGGFGAGNGAGIGSGNQVVLPVCVPITVSGNAIGHGSATSGQPAGCASALTSSPATPTDPTDPTTPVTPADPTTPTTADPGAEVLGVGPATVLGERLRSAQAATAGALAQTGGFAGRLLALGLLLVGLGISLRRTGRTRPVAVISAG